MLRRTMLLWWAILTLLVAGFSTMAAPTSASAIGYCDPNRLTADYCEPVRTATAGINHIGWVYLNLNYCPPGMMCAAVYTGSTSAWSWNGSAWRPATLRQGWVYVYPYTGSWRWAWTQSSGWVALNSGRFELRGY